MKCGHPGLNYWEGSQLVHTAICSSMVQVYTDLAEAVLEGQSLDAQHFHLLHLFLVEELHLVHGDDAVAVQVHAAEPVLDTDQTQPISSIYAPFSTSPRNTTETTNMLDLQNLCGPRVRRQQQLLTDICCGSMPDLSSKPAVRH